MAKDQPLSLYLSSQRDTNKFIHLHKNIQKELHTLKCFQTLQALPNTTSATIIPTLISDSRAPPPPPYRLCTHTHQITNLGTLKREKEFGFVSGNRES